MPWVSDRFGVSQAPESSTPVSGGWVQQRFSDATPTPSAQPASGGWVSQRFTEAEPTQKSNAVPYPVAPADVFGMPEDERPGFITRFFQELPGVVSDLGQIALGPDGGPTQPRKPDPALDAARGRLAKDFSTTKAVVEDNLATRSLGRAGLEVGALLQNAVLRPIEFFGSERAGEFADRTNRVLADMAREDSEKTAKGWIAQNLGQGVARGADSITESLGKAFFGGLIGKSVATAKAGVTFMFGASSADQALTEAKDFRFEDGSSLSPTAQKAYAAGVGGLEAALMLAGGKLASSLGLETAEEALFSTQIKPMISQLLTRSGAKEALLQAGKAAAGAGIEAGEEGLTELTQQVWKSIYAGEEDSAIDRVVAKLKDKELWKNVGESALVGAGSRGAFGAANKVASGVEAIAKELPAIVERAAALVKSEAGGMSVQSGSTAPISTGEQTPAAPATPAAQQPVAQPSAAPQTAPSDPGAPPAPPAEPPSSEPPARVPPSANQPPAPGVSPKNAAMATMAKRMFGRDIPYSPERVKWNQSVDLAAAAGIPDKAISIATSVNLNPRELSHVETAGLTMRLVQLEQDYTAAARNVSAAGEMGDSALAMIHGDQVNQLEQEFFTIREALLKAGSEQGRNFAARKMTLGENFDVLPVLGRLQTAKRGPVSPQEKAAITVIVEQHGKLDAELQAKVREQNEQVVTEFLARSKKSKASTSPEDQARLYQRLQELLESACDLE